MNIYLVCDIYTFVKNRMFSKVRKQSYVYIRRVWKVI